MGESGDGGGFGGSGGGFGEGVVGGIGISDKVDGNNDVKGLIGGFEFMGSNYSGNNDSNNITKQDSQGY